MVYISGAPRFWLHYLTCFPSPSAQLSSTKFKHLNLHHWVYIANLRIVQGHRAAKLAPTRIWFISRIVPLPAPKRAIDHESTTMTARAKSSVTAAFLIGQIDHRFQAVKKAATRTRHKMSLGGGFHMWRLLNLNFCTPPHPCPQNLFTVYVRKFRGNIPHLWGRHLRKPFMHVFPVKRGAGGRFMSWHDNTEDIRGHPTFISDY